MLLRSLVLIIWCEVASFGSSDIISDEMVKYRLRRYEIISDEMVKYFPYGEMLRGCAAIIGVRIWGVFCGMEDGAGVCGVGGRPMVALAPICEAASRYFIGAERYAEQPPTDTTRPYPEGL